MQFKSSQRASSLSMVEQLAAKARALAAQGKSIISLQVGQPSTGAPAGAITALIKIMQEQPLGYTPAAGIPELRQRIARHYLEEYKVPVDPKRILITTGGSSALILAVLGCFDSGARIGLPLPFYSGYRHALKALDVECVGFTPIDHARFQPAPQDIENIVDGIAGLIVANPGNPTGSMLKPDEINTLASYCAQHKIRLIFDETYHGIVYQNDFPVATALQFSPETIVINSFSKYYSMAGWRIGWMVIPDYLADPLTDLAHNLFLAPPAPSQYAALAAFECQAELKQHVTRYAHNRDILLRELPQAGFDRFTTPDGAFYVYCRIQHLRGDSLQFCIDMLEGCGVLASPGLDYDPHHGHHFIRFSYAGATKNIEEAAQRIKTWRAQSERN
jgi:aspartate/methionine/tyrosine aminotransferase